MQRSLTLQAESEAAQPMPPASKALHKGQGRQTDTLSRLTAAHHSDSKALH